MNSAANEMAKRAGQFEIDVDTGGFRQSSRNKLGIYLSRYAPPTPAIQSFWKHEGRYAFPDLSTLGGTKNRIELHAERSWQAPEHVQITAAYHSDLEITRTAFRPRSPQSADGSLSRIAKAHRRMNDDVVESAVTIEVNRNRMGMFMVVVKGSIELIFPGEFRTGHAKAIPEATDDRSMEQLGLR